MALRIGAVVFLVIFARTYGERTTVISNQADVVFRNEVIGTVYRGQGVEILERRGAKVVIRFEFEGRKVTGLLGVAHLELEGRPRTTQSTPDILETFEKCRARYGNLRPVEGELYAPT